MIETSSNREEERERAGGGEEKNRKKNCKRNTHSADLNRNACFLIDSMNETRFNTHNF